MKSWVGNFGLFGEKKSLGVTYFVSLTYVRLFRSLQVEWMIHLGTHVQCTIEMQIRSDVWHLRLSMHKPRAMVYKDENVCTNKLPTLVTKIFIDLNCTKIEQGKRGEKLCWLYEPKQTRKMYFVTVVA